MAAALAHRVASRIVPPAVAASALESASSSILNSSFLLPGQDKVICRWWRGDDVVDPARYLINGQGKLTAADVHENSTLASEMRAKFADTGLCHVTNTGLDKQGSDGMLLQRDLARILIGHESEYEGGANPRGRHEALGNVYDIGAP